MRGAFLLTILLTLFCLILLNAQDGTDTTGVYKPVLKLSGDAEFDFSANDSYGLAKVSQTQYLYAKIYNRKPENEKWIIIEQKTFSEFNDMAEGVMGKINAAAYSINNRHQSEKIWSLESDANEGAFALGNAFYQTVQYGCCGALNVHRLFSLNSGKLVLEHTGSVLKSYIPNYDVERYIGYKGGETYPEYDFEKDKRYIGTLYYASKDSLKTKIIIRCIKKDFSDIYELGWSKLSFVRGDSAQEFYGDEELAVWQKEKSESAPVMGGFSVKLTFDNAEIILPVVNDDIDISGYKSKIFDIKKYRQ
jgi:hypothetical protein